LCFIVYLIRSTASQATAILLGCHPESSILNSFFQDKADLIKTFLCLLRTGPGSLDYESKERARRGGRDGGEVEGVGGGGAMEVEGGGGGGEAWLGPGADPCIALGAVDVLQTSDLDVRLLACHCLEAMVGLRYPPYIHPNPTP
jgi:hypothetical protein